MCQTGAGGKSHFHQSLECIVSCMRDRILGSQPDLVGVLLFGTEKTKVPNGHQGFNHVYLLQDLEEPSATSMRKISLIMAEQQAKATAAAGYASPGGAAKSEEGAKTEDTDFGHIASSDDFDLSNVLWVTSMLFNSSAAKNTRRRVYLLTNDDNPCAASAGARSRALTRSKDLQDANVWIEPFFFAPTPPATFDLGEQSFWRELVGKVRQNYKPARRSSSAPTGASMAAAPSAADAYGGGGGGGGDDGSGGGGSVGGGYVEDQSEEWLKTCVASEEAQLLEKVRRKAHRKRPLWSSDLIVRDGYSISFLMVSIVKSQAKPTSKKLEARTNEELSSETKVVDTSEGTALQKEDLFKAYQFGGRWVYFDAAELATFGKEEGISNPGLTLLGFKDESKLKLHHTVDKAKFIEATEATPGSTQAMSALVDAMHAKGKMALARMSKGAIVPRLVALLPQPRVEEDLANGVAPLPCVMLVVPLPFADDVRSIKKPAALSNDDFTEPQLTAARDLVNALRLPKGKRPIGTVANPAMATHYNYLEVMALNVPGDEVPPMVDGTHPDYAWLAERQPAVDAFREAFQLPDAEGAEEAAGGKKQKTSGGGGGGGVKKEKAATPTTLAEWINAHVAGRLASLTNPILKEFCKQQGLPVGGKKDDLLARVIDFLEEKMQEEAAAGGGAAASSAAAGGDEA